ncbi:hypothetical protein Tco_0917171 [Tanacetum coccineum]
MLRKGSSFSKESDEKSWEKESANESSLKNSDSGTESRSDNTVGSLHEVIIHGIDVFEGNEEVTEVIDVENWRIDNSRVLRWVVSLIEWNSSVSSTKSSIQTAGDGVTDYNDAVTNTSRRRTGSHDGVKAAWPNPLLECIFQMA